MIRDKEQYSTELIKLAAKDIFLENDDYTVSEVNIQNGSMLYIVRRVRGNIRIFIKAFTGETLILDYVSTETVRDIKKIIED